MRKIHFQDSAHTVAIARAIHQLLDEPIVLDDPLALPILGPELKDIVIADPYKYNEPGSRSMRAGIVARSLLAEEYVSAAIASGVRQVLLLGAGLDSFGLSQGTKLPRANLFEIDRTEMLNHKQSLLSMSGLKVPENLHFVPSDLSRKNWVGDLIEYGFDKSKPVAISCLGLIPYLNAEQVRQLLSQILELAPGSSLIFDYRVKTELLNVVEQAIVKVSEEVFSAMGEPWRSQFDPTHFEKELKIMGFPQVRTFGSSELNQRYFSRRKDGLQIAGGGFRYIVAQL
ncbi:SAM-dependent methyltransferase [Idiomarina sp. M1R2S28]|uniref:S-adenosyl-L-methionine-dependent methyltransferase n=1 Tax=Idiomarina rhizosphaerae TaxID=2961572 RepID=A0A9X2FUQ7_9GAMM|nr:SAM-dependent methyltransferase [Idiomarina rhizosphaerae]MCP1339589.1 SAM-dependent methyltransferase [Idiomarina rhizosphaerae]